MLSKNPCRYCVAAHEYKGRHHPGRTECTECDYNKEHKEYLQSRRMFEPGEPITDISELLKHEWVIWYGSTKHIEMFRSMQVRTVEMFLRNGAFQTAIRREK